MPGPSPAERYAASRQRSRSPRTEDFALGYDFGLDDFQLEACRALESGEGVLVAAPTGAGKTVVGEFAVHLALAEGRKCFYTTPIKALSNQKFRDLQQRHGADRVGLLTGDVSINADADVVVMTTEVLRNMLYAGSPVLANLGYVVMDEVHYLGDRVRGGVWEEVIIHLPDSVRLVSLSATVSNAEEFADWLVTVRGHTRVIVSEHRPVPLFQHMMIGRDVMDLFADSGGRSGSTVDRDLLRLAREAERSGAGPRTRGARPSQRPDSRRVRVPGRAEVVVRLEREGLLPAITFIFSRNGCDAAVDQCLRTGVTLTTEAEARAIRALVDERCAHIPRADRAVLGFASWREALERGLAAHHAGLLPAFKEVVEELFARGLVKAVFATETLALGINMPARTVVLERLVKWNGRAHADITPGEYTQLTGRAGRRGIDVEGHAVVLWQPGLDPEAVAGLASTRTYPLRSSFSPSYNMAVNLVGSVGVERARALLETSFAQFQADRSVVGLGRKVARNLTALEGYAEAMACHLGDFETYAALRRALSEREAALSREGSANRRAEAAQSLERLKVGDVVRVPAGKRGGLAVVVETGTTATGEPLPLVVTTDRWAGRLGTGDFPHPVEPLGHVKVPKHFNHRSPAARRDLASSIRALDVAPDAGRLRKRRAAAADDETLLRLRRELRAHPCHGCDEREDHARWGERWSRLRRETDAVEADVSGRTGTIARTFDSVCAVLREHGYLLPDADGVLVVTPAGARLTRIYGESDLLAAECLRQDLWQGLSPAQLASAASVLVYSSRRDDVARPRVPAGAVAHVVEETRRLWLTLSDAESRHGLSFLPEPDPGFAEAAFLWASGEPLERVLASGGEDGLGAGDFVRWVRQLIDLLGQVAVVARDSDLGPTAAAAIDALRRGVLAYSQPV